MNINFDEALEMNEDNDRKLFADPQEFSIFIEKQSIETNRSCLDVILEFCEDNLVDYDEIATMISYPLKKKLEVDFANEGLLKITPSLENLF